jgi:protein-S-isoprenylcysteine O-methyltransferase Ste14
LKENRLLPFMLPLSVTVIVPGILVRLFGKRSPCRSVQLPVGMTLITMGFFMLAWTVSLFRRIGKGSLASWDPTRELVVEGPYSHTRNPMISGVLSILAGESVLFGSWPILVWASVFCAINTTYFKLFEERGLLERFGDDYALYLENVPMWLPRVTSWNPTPRS